MMRHGFIYLYLLLISSAALFPLVVEAMEFSADTYQQSPKGIPQKSKMFVGTNLVRKEYEKDGTKIIEIYDLGKKSTLVLFPATNSYIVKKQPVSAFTNRSISSKAFNPCTGLQNTRCFKVGIESVNGFNAEKWRLESRKNSEVKVAEYWIDRERLMVLKEHLHDSTQVEMRLMGQETLHERSVEKWERVTIFPNQERFSALQWYDSQLGMFIREEMPGGYLRELLNIRTGPQPDTLFEIPAGYKMIDREAVPKGMENSGSN